MIKIESIHTYYGSSHILHGMNFQAKEGEVVSLLGRNGVGKTTTMRSIMGMSPPREGSIRFKDHELTILTPHEIFRLGIKIVPQGRRIFPNLNVEENLRLAMIHLRANEQWRELEKAYQFFPILGERRKQRGDCLSGGEQQMLAIARALVGDTQLILMDEPSEGLAPVVIQEIAQFIVKIKHEAVTIILAEQNYKLAMQVADKHNIMEKGKVAFSGTSHELDEKPEIVRDYLGIKPIKHN